MITHAGSHIAARRNAAKTKGRVAQCYAQRRPLSAVCVGRTIAWAVSGGGNRTLAGPHGGARCKERRGAW